MVSPLLDGETAEQFYLLAKGPAEQALQHMVMQLQANPAERFIIVGHADKSGTALYNLTLSLSRAKQIRKQLINQFNINSQQLSVVGAGATGVDASFRKALLIRKN